MYLYIYIYYIGVQSVRLCRVYLSIYLSIYIYIYIPQVCTTCASAACTCANADDRGLLRCVC